MLSSVEIDRFPLTIQTPLEQLTGLTLGGGGSTQPPEAVGGGGGGAVVVGAGEAEEEEGVVGEGVFGVAGVAEEADVV